MQQSLDHHVAHTEPATLETLANRPRLCISACLLGECVRYDGGDKRDEHLLDSVGAQVEWVAVCPEVECGLPVPRERMHLVGDPASPRLVTVSTGRDLSDRLRAWMLPRLSELAELNLAGAVLKSRSPCCSLRGLQVVGERGEPHPRRVTGLFAAALLARFPNLPMADEEELRYPEALRRFIESIQRLHSG